MKHSFEQAIDIIEKEKSNSDANVEAKKRATIRRDIGDFLKSRGEKKTP